MVIIDLMSATMGVAMGFLAFLVIGGLTSVFALFFTPGNVNHSLKPRNFSWQSW
jgi:hypothetical protein